MAIPTDFKGFTPAAGTTKTFKLLGSATVGFWVCDVDGTLSAGARRVDLGGAGDAVIILTGTYTDAQLLALVRDWEARIGGLVAGSGAGGQKTETTKQVAPTATTTS